METRIETLVGYDVGSAAVALCKSATDSLQCKELLSRIFLALTQNVKHRGKLVQQGGGKVTCTHLFYDILRHSLNTVTY